MVTSLRLNSIFYFLYIYLNIHGLRTIKNGHFLICLQTHATQAKNAVESSCVAIAIIRWPVHVICVYVKELTQDKPHAY